MGSRFLSTPPSRVATAHLQAMAVQVAFLSTPPSRVATEMATRPSSILSVSIHATLAGGDGHSNRTSLNISKVSIHATLAGGDCAHKQTPDAETRFYPRHPRGWRHWCDPQDRINMVVSIHATLAGGDFSSVTTLRLVCTFLSTPPSRVATWVFDGEVAGCFAFLSTPPSRVATVGLYFVQIKAGLVSIHATLAGGDSRRSGRQSPGQCFYPRHPRGWRRNNIPRRDNAPEFLSTPPSRVATCRG